MKNRPSRAIVGAALLLMVALLQGPVLAALRPGLSISPTKRIDSRKYPDPLIGTISPRNPGAAVDGTPSGCAAARPQAPYCDTIDLDIDAPEKIDLSTSYAARITLSWDPGPSQNNLDLVVWTCTNTQTRGGTCTRTGAARSTNIPEIVSMTDYPGGRYFITPQNVGGANSGYELKVEYIPGNYIQFNPRPKLGPPAPEGALTHEVPLDQDQGTQTEGESELSLPAVKTPGEDGEPMTTEVDTIAARQAGGGGVGIVRLTIIAVAVAAAASGAIVFVIRRRRKAGEEAGA